jgi:hypothetical protein
MDSRRCDGVRKGDLWGGVQHGNAGNDRVSARPWIGVENAFNEYVLAVRLRPHQMA